MSAEIEYLQDIVQRDFLVKPVIFSASQMIPRPSLKAEDRHYGHRISSPAHIQCCTNPVHTFDLSKLYLKIFILSKLLFLISM
jgi:hypothetical protein